MSAKLSLANLLAALAVAFCSGPVTAQQGATVRVFDGLALPAAWQAPSETPVAEKGQPCDGKSQHRCGLDPCQRWYLFPETRRGIQVGGWISGGVTVNRFGNRSGNGNAPLRFNNVADGFVFNQVWVFAERVADTGGYGTDWGVRVDYVFGADGPDTQSFGDGGWDFGWNSSRDYGSAIPQLYLELAYNLLSVKIGHFFTIMGFETVPAPANFFYSHAYAKSYGEPYTHTGALAQYQYNDCTDLYFGWTTGWDGGFDNLNDANTFLGGFRYRWRENITITHTINAGRFGDGFPANNGDIFLSSLVVEMQLTDRLGYVLQHDYATNIDLGPNNAQWYGLSQYLFWVINDCWQLGLRLEWFDDQDGVRVRSGTAGAGDYYEATLGLNWRPSENLRVRPELRWDWFDGAGNPFDNGTENDMLTFGIDAILLW